MNKDQSEGSKQNVKGRIKEATGAIIGKKPLEAEGAADRAQGAAKKAFGDVKHEVAKKLDK